MGDTTATIAATHPEIDYLAIEVHTPGVGSLLKAIEENGLTNIRIVQHDAVEVLEYMIPESSLDGAHVFFPDPWPKKRHHKRRLIQPPLVSLLASRIKPGGYLHAATDWDEYAQQILEVFSAERLLRNTAEGFAPRPDYRPLTRFEQRGLALGHGVWDVIFTRC
jgi:tRNA (guanine-N7-)-methyltransferase